MFRVQANASSENSKHTTTITLSCLAPTYRLRIKTKQNETKHKSTDKQTTQEYEYIKLITKQMQNKRRRKTQIKNDTKETSTKASVAVAYVNRMS